MAGLRRVLRTVLLHHLGGRGLKSWELLGQLQRVAERAGEGIAQSGDDKVS
jgi:DNA repair protein RecO (recombination protein O)